MDKLFFFINFQAGTVGCQSQPEAGSNAGSKIPAMWSCTIQYNGRLFGCDDGTHHLGVPIGGICFQQIMLAQNYPVGTVPAQFLPVHLVLPSKDNRHQVLSQLIGKQPPFPQQFQGNLFGFDTGSFAFQFHPDIDALIGCKLLLRGLFSFDVQRVETADVHTCTAKRAEIIDFKFVIFKIQGTKRAVIQAELACSTELVVNGKHKDPPGG